MQQAKINASVFKLSLIASAIAGISFSSASFAQEQTAIDEKALVEYPKTRRPASCHRWAMRTQVAFSRQGCAYDARHRHGRHDAQ